MNPTTIAAFTWQILPIAEEIMKCQRTSQQMTSPQTPATKTTPNATRGVKEIACMSKEEQTRGNTSNNNLSAISRKSLKELLKHSQWPTSCMPRDTWIMSTIQQSNRASIYYNT